MLYRRGELRVGPQCVQLTGTGAGLGILSCWTNQTKEICSTYSLNIAHADSKTKGGGGECGRKSYSERCSPTLSCFPRSGDESPPGFHDFPGIAGTRHPSFEHTTLPGQPPPPCCLVPALSQWFKAQISIWNLLHSSISITHLTFIITGLGYSSDN